MTGVSGSEAGNLTGFIAIHPIRYEFLEFRRTATDSNRASSVGFPTARTRLVVPHKAKKYDVLERQLKSGKGASDG